MIQLLSSNILGVTSGSTQIQAAILTWLRLVPFWRNYSFSTHTDVCRYDGQYALKIYEEALNGSYSRSHMREEIKGLEESGTWQLISVLSGRKATRNNEGTYW